MKVKVRAVKKKQDEPEYITISTEYIKLDSFLKFACVADSGGVAKEMIINGDVKVNGEVCTMRGKKLRDGDTVTFMGKTYAVKNPAQNDN